MRYAGILTSDVGNGPNVCATLFVQGCSHHCDNCFNPETWDFNDGQIFNRRVEFYFIEACQKEYIKNICILGGEPLDQGEDLLKLLQKLKKEVNKPIWLWTGYVCNDNLDNIQKEILKLCDVVIDGPFIKDLATATLKYRGSENQRVIDIKKSIESQQIVLYQGA